MDMRIIRSVFFCTFLLFNAAATLSQDCVGGQVYSNETFQYGRFEVAMRSAQGSGIVSSFFLYNLNLNCNWPAENNEIDIEMTGNSENIYFTTHYPGPWSFGDFVDPSFNPHNAIHNYAFEWEPGIVRWFVDGQLVYVQSQSFVNGLIHPMNIMMNLWAAEAESWVGPWNPSVMPVESEYDFVRYYEYTPGSGNFGTNNNFSLVWEDDFSSFDPDRWTIEQNGGFGGNYCRFKSTSVDFDNGKLYLKLEEPAINPETIPVTFSVDLNGQNLQTSDVIRLNGSFNDWCGNCATMSESNGIWSLTLGLEPGSHEFLFTKNFWEENGGAPLGSTCDFTPCDEYANYGLVVNSGSAPIILDTYCWGECTPCEITSIIDIQPKPDKKLIRICDLLGREVEYRRGQALLYYYDDGSVEQRVSFE